VIVNSAVKNLKLENGRASNALIQATGQGIQTECDNKYPNGINHGEIAITSGGNLSFKYIYHGSLPKYANAGDEHVRTTHVYLQKNKTKQKQIIARNNVNIHFICYYFENKCFL